MTRFRTLPTALVLAAGLLATGPTAATASAPTVDQRTAPLGHWAKVHWHMNAYPDPDDGSSEAWRGCSGTWSDDHGSCWGRGEAHHSQPFIDRVRWEWHRQPTHCADFPGRDHQVWTHELYLRTTDGSQEWVCGWVDRHWGTFRIVDGRIHQVGIRPISPTTDVVADREHTQGGPLFVFLGHRDGGYVLGMRGWIHY